MLLAKNHCKYFLFSLGGGGVREMTTQCKQSFHFYNSLMDHEE